MSERHSLFDTITDSIVPVHSDGYKFLAIGIGVALFFFWLWPPLAWVAVVVTAWRRLSKMRKMLPISSMPIN